MIYKKEDYNAINNMNQKVGQPLFTIFTYWLVTALKRI